MTNKESQQLAALKQEVSDLKEDLKLVQTTVSDIKATLDNLSGGRQAIMWVTGTILVIAGLIISALHLRK